MNAKPAALATRCPLLAGLAAFAFLDVDTRYADA
jgi:hypothetical protein